MNTDKLQLEITVTGIEEVDVFISVELDGDSLDLIGCSWVTPVKDHGKVFCKQCRESGSEESFDTYEALYLHHFECTMKAIEYVMNAEALWVYRTDGGSTAVDIDRLDPARKDGVDGWCLVPIESVVVVPLRTAERRSRHKRAVHKLLSQCYADNAPAEA